MYIKNNHIANKLYVPYTQNINNLSKSAQRLATGEKMPTVAIGGGELGVADRWSQVVRSNAKLKSGMENGMGYLATQDEVLQQATEVLQRMSELAASALDTTKNTGDRLALDAEFQALGTEMAQLAGRQYNGISLFGHVLSIRFDAISLAGARNATTLSAINLGAITFGALNLSQLTSASTALVSIKSRITSVNIFKGYAGNNANELSRVIDYSQTHSNELKNGENHIRGIDLAVETGEFTKQQVILAASQSVLAQSNGIIQSAMQFLG